MSLHDITFFTDADESRSPKLTISHQEDNNWPFTVRIADSGNKLYTPSIALHMSEPHFRSFADSVVKALGLLEGEKDGQ